MTRLWAAVPAAVSGSRMGGPVPKQYLRLRGRSILEWSVDRLLTSKRIAGCAIALPAGDTVASAALFEDPRVMRCAGGATRAESVASALDTLPGSADDWVLVHDAARPCLPESALETLIDTVLESGIGGLLAQPQTDTLKRVDASLAVRETVDREGLWRAQTPQMFRLHELREALRQALNDGRAITDEASAMESEGFPVQLIEGPVCNLKVTFPADLALADYWLDQERQALGSSVAMQTDGKG